VPKRKLTYSSLRSGFYSPASGLESIRVWRPQRDLIPADTTCWSGSSGPEGIDITRAVALTQPAILD
jgi:hypothetical protein